MRHAAQLESEICLSRHGFYPNGGQQAAELTVDQFENARNAAPVVVIHVQLMFDKRLIKDWAGSQFGVPFVVTHWGQRQKSNRHRHLHRQH